MRLALFVTIFVIAAVVVGALLPEVPRWLVGLVTLIGPPLFLAALRNASDAIFSSRSSDESSNRSDGEATCEHCGAQFEYYLVHNGFNDSAYAYCDTCGATTLLGGWASNIPMNVDLRIHEPITPALEEHLAACSCGGRFRADASPRCPHCRHPLSAIGLTKHIEKNAPGTKAGWRWQQNWSGLYAIVVENRMTQDNWVTRATEEGDA
jgi:hypothetical protein